MALRPAQGPAKSTPVRSGISRVKPLLATRLADELLCTSRFICLLEVGGWEGPFLAVLVANRAFVQSFRIDAPQTFLVGRSEFFRGFLFPASRTKMTAAAASTLRVPVPVGQLTLWKPLPLLRYLANVAGRPLAHGAVRRAPSEGALVGVLLGANDAGEARPAATEKVLLLAAFAVGER